MDTKKDTQVIKQEYLMPLKQIFQKAGVLSAYLFGSAAENVQRRCSDLDIAVRLRPQLNADARHRIRMDLAGELEALLQRPVDVVLLDDASLLMHHQVFKNGIPIYIRDVQKEEAFRLEKRKLYFDFQYYLKKDRKDLRAFYGC